MTERHDCATRSSFLDLSVNIRLTELNSTCLYVFICVEFGRILRNDSKLLLLSFFRNFCYFFFARKNGSAHAIYNSNIYEKIQKKYYQSKNIDTSRHKIFALFRLDLVLLHDLVVNVKISTKVLIKCAVCVIS